MANLFRKTLDKFGAKQPELDPKGEHQEAAKKPIESEAETDYQENQKTTDPFRYSALQPNPRAFRLLYLLPGTRQDDIECSLVDSDLDQDADTFEALSYVWGDVSVTTPIQVNDLTLQIGKNLRQFLLNLRQTDKPRVLWADAVCINQGSIEERNRQVGLMRDIYKHASSAVVWLGESTKKTSKVFDALEILEKEARELREAGQSHTIKLRTGPAYEAHTSGWSWPDYKEVLLENEWWQRAWTLQEIILPKKAVLVSGTYTVDFDKFSTGIIHAKKLGLFDDSYFGNKWKSGTEPFDMVHAIKAAPELPNVGDEFLYYLASSHERAATNPRDNIFAVLGLFKAGRLQGTGIEPDYAIEPGEIYRRATKVIIERSGKLDVLGFCYPYTKRVVSDLPSWVPDWGSTGNLAEPLMKNARGETRTTHASKGSTCHPRWDDSGKVLILRGHVIDTITKLSVVQPRVYFDDIAEGSMDFLDEYLPDEGFPGEWADNPDDPDRPLRDIARENWQLMKGGAKAIKYGTMQMVSIAGHADKYLQWQEFIKENANACESESRMIFRDILSTETLYPEGQARTEEAFRKWLATLSPVRKLKSWKADKYLPEPLFHSIGFVSKMKDLVSNDGNDSFSTYISQTNNRRVGVTEGSHICLLPKLTEVGDKVALLEGGRVPIILRPQTDDLSGSMQLIGEAYIRGFMNGEGWDEDKCVEIHLT
ncbi:heterokaryon incompatibility protein-domain-containing protein [Cladorrhinum sp. PSN259]|nr:heterokaryon incompatibility protein-domain-containing protein [Cladorrhinum sp. PSN259]